MINPMEPPTLADMADMANEMRQRASLPGLQDSTRDLLRSWADALDHIYGEMDTEYARLCRDYDMAAAALKQNEQVLKRLSAENTALWPLVEALATATPQMDIGRESAVFPWLATGHQYIELARTLVAQRQEGGAI